MAYCAVGSMSTADWNEIKKLCSSLRKDINTKLTTLESKLEDEINSLDTNQIQTLKNKLLALSNEVSSFSDWQDRQDTRLDSLEEKAANLEMTTSEILEAYNGV